MPGGWEHAPPGNFMLWDSWLLRSFIGSKMSLEFFALFLLWEHNFDSLLPSVSAVSGTHGKPRKETSHESKWMFCFAFSLDLIPSHTVQEYVAIVLKICSFSGSKVLFYACAVMFVLALICANDMRVSRLQAKGRRHHLWQNIGPADTGSAKSASPALLRWPCTSFWLSIKYLPHNIKCVFTYSCEE